MDKDVDRRRGHVRILGKGSWESILQLCYDEA